MLPMGENRELPDDSSDADNVRLMALVGEGDTSAFEQLIARLRRKIGSDRIETKRGFGYQLADAGA